MTKSTITRECLEEIVSDPMINQGSEFAMVARIALAAMDSEPVEMPLDYLQGHKDGLEWASQLAEANHPETGDWLYDDPIELAKAIRKGPDMPPVQPVADSEPVAWTWKHLKQWYVTNDEERARELAWDGVKVEQLYRHAQPAAEREQVRSAHAEWSQETFGNVGPVGPLKHLSKEAQEAAEQPGDLSEWADMQFLLWDAQRRAGITDEQITQAMIEKLAVNKQREWPEPKDGEPRLHIKEQPAQVVPDAYVRDEGGRMMLNGVCEPKIGFGTGWNACRSAMLQASPICTCPSGDGSLRWPCPVHPGNSPAIPDSARDALEKALAAMEFMGDTLNNLDAVCTEDVELVAPAFDAVRNVLAAAQQEGK